MRVSSSPDLYIDYSFICLIPKKKGAAHANDFRPISLINSIQKIISKVLSNRLGVMHETISTSQSAFLKDRLLLDSFVTANELVAWDSYKAVEGVGVKVDFEKAYDKVSWEFLFKIMNWLGFGEK